MKFKSDFCIMIATSFLLIYANYYAIMNHFMPGMIKDIYGDHYYLTEEQNNYILDHFESVGIPTYAIYDTQGHQTYKNIGFPGTDVIRKELETASK